MDTVIIPDRNILLKGYEELLPARILIARELEQRIEEAVISMASIPRVKGRIKSFESYFKKYIRYLKNGPCDNPLQVNDLIGIRIVCPFLEDLSATEELLKKKFDVIEVERKGGDHTFREFGYESIHLLIAIPQDIIEKHKIPTSEIAEIQIRTILQDAWAEVEHELVYKAEFTPFDNPLKRKLAAVNASLSLADIIFQEIRSYQRALNGQLEQRRDSFFRKIEESTDAILFTDEKDGGQSDLSYQTDWHGTQIPSNVSIDELLLDALYAHNKHQFDKAIAVYTVILDMNPDVAVRSLIHKHRGMAYFARSHYEKAIEDFSASLELDPLSYKAAYYEGVVCSVLRRYPQAVNAFNRALEINPYQAYCFYRRGQAYFHLGDYPQALGDCEAALALESFEAGQKFRDLLLNKLKM
jgi:putative GTP pyrophosphokinase